MIYVEYVSRRQGIALDDFHRVVRQVQEAWAAGHGTDRLILNAGRTWRLGPEPEYLGIWDTGDAGFERLDAWTRAFQDRGQVGDEATMSRVARIDVAGCYRALDTPAEARGGIYYVETFRPAGAGEQIRLAYRDRARKHPSLSLNLIAVRIGRLAPDPGGLAVWTLPDFAALSSIASELDGSTTPVELVSAGVYTDIGKEIL